MSDSKTIPDGVDNRTALTAIAWEIAKDAMKYKTTEGDLKFAPETYIDKITALFRKALDQLENEPRED